MLFNEFLSLLFSTVVFLFRETKSHYVILAGLELTDI